MVEDAITEFNHLTKEMQKIYDEGRSDNFIIKAPSLE